MRTSTSSSRGALLRSPDLNLVQVQDAGLSGADEPTVLEWAAREGRVLLTHDMATMTRHTYDRVRAGLPMPGAFEVSHKVAIGAAIEEILLLAHCSEEGEWEGQVRYLPSR